MRAVEAIEGKVSCKPLVKDTRIPADAIVGNFLAGSPVEEVAENYPGAPVETIRGILEYGLARLAWDDETLVDWKGCALVERVPGRCSGAWTVVGTRVFPDAIVGDYELGCSLDRFTKTIRRCRWRRFVG